MKSKVRFVHALVTELLTIQTQLHAVVDCCPLINCR